MSKTVSLSFLEMAILDKIFQTPVNICKENFSANVESFTESISKWKQEINGTDVQRRNGWYR